MARNKYTVDYFIKKFKAIPGAKWGVNSFMSAGGNKMCALGHCGLRAGFLQYTPEADALGKLIAEADESVTVVNDGLSPKYKQRSPKGRILACLKDIKKRQDANK
jgi:hypothetical protein